MPSTVRLTQRSGIDAGRLPLPTRLLLARSIPPRLVLAQERLHTLTRERVGLLIFGVTRVAFEPMPGHLVLGAGLVEALPELDVLDGLFVRGLPAAQLPALHPSADPVPHVFRIGKKIDAGRPLQRFKRSNRGHQLHAVVGSQRLAAEDLFAMLAGHQNRAPSARARVAGTGAVGVDHHDRFCPRDHPNPYSLAETMVR